MGYRNYIGYLPKREYNKIKKMSLKEFCEYKGIDYQGENDTWISKKEILTAELYEFGKYCNFKRDGLGKKFFTNKEMDEQNNNEDMEFVIIKDKVFLSNIIDNYANSIKEMYKSMLVPFETEEHGRSAFLNSQKQVFSADPSHDYDYIYDFSLITIEEQTALQKLIAHARANRIEWEHGSVFELNDEKPTISESWRYEYAIFELVRIYKEFDWNKNVMVYYGY